MTLQNKDRKKTKQKKPKKITPSYLQNAALFYLERYATSVENFRQVMIRKIIRSCLYYEEPPEPYYPLVEDLIERYIASGLLNDTFYAESKIRSLRRQGNSQKMIQQKLLAKGLTADLTSSALKTIDQEIDENQPEKSELIAAQRYAQRRRLGPYRTREKEDSLQKDLASMARAGYSYEIAKQVLHKQES